ncbi:hypothetical protein D3C87_1513890 [compost metagenome]
MGGAGLRARDEVWLEDRITRLIGRAAGQHAGCDQRRVVQRRVGQQVLDVAGVRRLEHRLHVAVNIAVYLLPRSHQVGHEELHTGNRVRNAQRTRQVVRAGQMGARHHIEFSAVIALSRAVCCH